MEGESDGKSRTIKYKAAHWILRWSCGVEMEARYMSDCTFLRSNGINAMLIDFDNSMWTQLLKDSFIVHSVVIASGQTYGRCDFIFSAEHSYNTHTHTCNTLTLTYEVVIFYYRPHSIQALLQGHRSLSAHTFRQRLRNYYMLIDRRSMAHGRQFRTRFHHPST